MSEGRIQHEIATICPAPAIATSTAQKVYTRRESQTNGVFRLCFSALDGSGVGYEPRFGSLPKKNGPFFEGSPRYQIEAEFGTWGPGDDKWKSRFEVVL